MPSPLQDILASAAVGCAVMSAIYNDRMAKELRETGEARYADPRLTPGRPLSRRKSDLEFNHEQRFPQSSTRRNWKIFINSFAVLLSALPITLIVHRPAPTLQTQFSQSTDR
jgi:hypothetical protein